MTTIAGQKGGLNLTCINCSFKIVLKFPNVIHSGFSDSGFMYCEDCGKVVTWSSFDKRYLAAIVDSVNPWQLTEEQKKLIENIVKHCDCGGTFSYKAHPRCTNCKTELPLATDDIYYYKVNGHLDGEKENIWKNIK